MEDRTEEGYAGLFQVLFAMKKSGDHMPGRRYPAGRVVFLEKSRKKKAKISFLKYKKID